MALEQTEQRWNIYLIVQGQNLAFLNMTEQVKDSLIEGFKNTKEYPNTSGIANLHNGKQLHLIRFEEVGYLKVVPFDEENR